MRTAQRSLADRVFHIGAAGLLFFIQLMYVLHIPSSGEPPAGGPRFEAPCRGDDCPLPHRHRPPHDPRTCLICTTALVVVHLEEPLQVEHEVLHFCEPALQTPDFFPLVVHGHARSPPATPGRPV